VGLPTLILGNKKLHACYRYAFFVSKKGRKEELFVVLIFDQGHVQMFIYSL